MKKLLSIILALLVLGFIASFFLWRLDTSIHQYTDISTIKETPALTETPKPLTNLSVTLGNKKYAYAYFSVADPNKISLIPNFSEKIDVKTLMEQNNCNEAINGGFYDTNNRPLGYFASKEKILGNAIPSSLVNAFIWKDQSGHITVSSNKPPEGTFFGLQTGPLLIYNQQALPLTMRSDKPARRMIAAETKNGTTIFMTLYDGENVYEGPLLADTPSVVLLVANDLGTPIAAAVNLDGGSASAFYSETTKLSELTPSGSIFCTK